MLNEFVKKLRSQPENVRKIILWSVVIIVGLALSALWILNIRRNVKNFPGEKFMEGLNLPALEEEMKNIPSIETLNIPDININEEDFKKLEEEMGKADLEERGNGETLTPAPSPTPAPTPT